MSEDQGATPAPEGPADYTIKEAAGLLGLSREALRRRTERGNVKVEVGERRGRAIQVIPREEFLRLKAEMPASTPPPGAQPRRTTSPGVHDSGPADEDAMISGRAMVAELTRLAEELGATRALVASTEARERAEQDRARAAEEAMIQARAEALAAQQRIEAAEARAAAAEMAAEEALAEAMRVRSEAEAATQPRAGFWARLFGAGQTPPPPTAT